MSVFSRAFDILASIIGLIVFSPIIIIALIAVWLQDWKSPIYSSHRIGKNGRNFPFYKIRSMVVGADKTGRHTVGSDDPNVTRLGRFLRSSKADELLQFYSVLRGDMRLVGPRPNIAGASTDIFTERERDILKVKPGITDFASIVFSDLDKIMIGAEDVNLQYNTRIRPWKSRLCLFYVENHDFLMDMRLIFLTTLNFVNRPTALRGTVSLLQNYSANEELIDVAKRNEMPPKKHPPGAGLVTD